MGQHIVADGLAVPQPATVADHQPRLRAQHRQVVGNGLGVGGADADVDQGDPLAVFGHQVISGHLMLAPGGFGHSALEMFGLRRDRDETGEGQGRVPPARSNLPKAPADELVHVAGVVGEKDVVLHVLGRRAGVMFQPRQGEIHSRRVE